jgi:NADH:ubiquinone oxidoreductase subunit F (NADH-binding)/(2Fe-2S) ferredoxin
MIKTVSELEAWQDRLNAGYDPKKIRIRVCMTGCRASGADALTAALKRELAALPAKSRGLIELVETGCHGFCAQAPVVEVDPSGAFYGQAKPADAKEIINRALAGTEPDVLARDIPFYSSQKRSVLRNLGRIDPRSIEDYIRRGGYMAMARALGRMTPNRVINELENSGLRGRGGAGFPTFLKWRLARKERAKPKYLICNGDEGDPGAFMDRGVMEGDPHAVIEGMIIAAFAIGCDEGYIYVRAEYPLAVEHLTLAIEKARENGLLGGNILGTGFSFDIKVKEGAGAFVCGEETALIASLEGKRGTPRPRPPYPAQSGLWGKPTCINNVETLANVPVIIGEGADAYNDMGSGTSRGTKVFSLAGKLNNTGLVEVPMGITLRELIFDLGGGIPGGKEFKAVQMGGPSGGCIPAEFLDLSVTYDTLSKVGAIMGSGGVIVLDETACMVDIARYFLQFSAAESCGKCTPCRVGTTRMLEILDRIAGGNGKLEDIDLLIETAGVVRDTALCGLGQNAPNPVLSTIRYFRDEYVAHIEHKKCPHGVCKRRPARREANYA